MGGPRPRARRRRHPRPARGLGAHLGGPVHARQGRVPDAQPLDARLRRRALRVGPVAGPHPRPPARADRPRVAVRSADRVRRRDDPRHRGGDRVAGAAARRGRGRHRCAGRGHSRRLHRRPAHLEHPGRRDQRHGVHRRAAAPDPLRDRRSGRGGVEPGDRTVLHRRARDRAAGSPGALVRRPHLAGAGVPILDVVVAGAGFVALGFGIGTLGTLIGAGGGFILLPVLALLSPQEPTGTLTATSLAVVAANATSGAIAYGRQRRIDLRSGIAFAIATLPGSIAGALLARSVPRGAFDAAFGLVLLALAAVLVRTRTEQGPAAPEGRVWGRVPRVLVDASGIIHRYSVELPLGIAMSFVIGFASSLLGIGGGFIHVPALIALLGFPVHIATATSHFVLAIMATAGTITHVAAGDLVDVWPRAAYIGAGAVGGAQLGARLSRRVRGPVIVRVLAVAHAIVAVRLGAPGLLGG